MPCLEGVAGLASTERRRWSAITAISWTRCGCSGQHGGMSAAHPRCSRPPVQPDHDVLEPFPHLVSQTRGRGTCRLPRAGQLGVLTKGLLFCQRWPLTAMWRSGTPAGPVLRARGTAASSGWPQARRSWWVVTRPCSCRRHRPNPRLRAPPAGPRPPALRGRWLGGGGRWCAAATLAARPAAQHRPCPPQRSSFAMIGLPFSAMTRARRSGSWRTSSGRMMGMSSPE